jgi:hypothetical protein
MVARSFGIYQEGITRCLQFRYFTIPSELQQNRKSISKYLDIQKLLHEQNFLVQINYKFIAALTALFVIVCLYSPLSRSFYNDWVNGRKIAKDAEDLKKLLESYSSGKHFEEKPSKLFSGNWQLVIKPLSGTLVGLKALLSPTPPDRAGLISRYIFDVSFLDTEGFVLHEIRIFENLMTAIVGDDGTPESLVYNDTIKIPIDIFSKIDRLSIGYISEAGRADDYESLRFKSAAEILSDRSQKQAIRLLQEAEDESNRQKSEMTRKKSEDIARKNEDIARKKRAIAWRELRKEMTKEDVENLLGKPLEIKEYGSFSVYRYEELSSITFSYNNTVSVFNTPSLSVGE